MAKRRATGGKGHRKSSVNAEIDRMCRGLDKLAKYESWQKDIQDLLPPELWADLKSGASGKDLRGKYSPFLTARAIAIALKSEDAGKAMGAIRDLLDREEGRAVEKKEIKHQLEDLSEKQLDALLLTEMSDLNTEIKNRAPAPGDGPKPLKH
jgi:hypothetical protein